MTFEQKKDLRGYFGGGAETRFWRAFQKAIANDRSDFVPNGLKEYWDNEAKLYNTESLQYLAEIRKAVKDLFERELEKSYGKDWVIKALPKTIYTRAKSVADEQNYEMISAGQSGEEISIWDCVSLTECKSIATVGNHWATIFENLLVRPEDEKLMGGKETKTEWLSKVESISNKLQQRTSYSVTAEEFEFSDKTVQGAVGAIAKADALIVGGTSLVVYPAAGFLDFFRGRHLVVVNKTPTQADARADLVINAPIGEVFAAI